MLNGFTVMSVFVQAINYIVIHHYVRLLCVSVYLNCAIYFESQN